MKGSLIPFSYHLDLGSFLVPFFGGRFFYDVDHLEESRQLICLT